MMDQIDESVKREYAQLSSGLEWSEKRDREDGCFGNSVWYCQPGKCHEMLVDVSVSRGSDH